MAFSRKRARNALLVAGAVSITAIVVEKLMPRVAEPSFEVVSKENDFEIRAYEARVVAETSTNGDFDAAGSEGFRRLAGYIFGGNRTQAKIEMTAPVAQRESRKLEMTAPVAQRRDGDTWIVAFTMPKGETLESLPTPLDARVVLRALPPSRFAIVRFSGRWTDANMESKVDALRAWVTSKGLVAVGAPEINRYDPPWTLWFLRRNEVWLEITADKP